MGRKVYTVLDLSGPPRTPDDLMRLYLVVGAPLNPNKKTHKRRLYVSETVSFSQKLF